MLSIIVPCYNEEKVIQVFYKELKKVVSNNDIKYELIFIDDGSKDKTIKVIENFIKKDKNIELISFSRNFGKEAAMLAGLEAANGDFVVLMDSDLQDPPKLLPTMLKTIIDEGYDSVATRRVSRQGEPAIRSIFARFFYKLINKLSSTDIVDGARDYRMMTKQMKDSIISLREYHRFSKGIFGWVGFETKWIEYENVERAAGETKWSFFKLFKYALEGIIGFTTLPLRFSTFTGFLTCICSFIYFIYILLSTLIFGNPTSGYASTLVIILLLGGIQLFTIGILGEYLAKTYIEIKRRPIYIVKKRVKSNDRNI
ncbi:MAG: glycosyltransferase family 2 protein [Bacilli bacterium]